MPEGCGPPLEKWPPYPFSSNMLPTCLSIVLSPTLRSPSRATAGRATWREAIPTNGEPRSANSVNCDPTRDFVYRPADVLEFSIVMPHYGSARPQMLQSILSVLPDVVIIVTP